MARRRSAGAHLALQVLWFYTGDPGADDSLDPTFLNQAVNDP